MIDRLAWAAALLLLATVLSGCSAPKESAAPAPGTPTTPARDAAPAPGPESAAPVVINHRPLTHDQLAVLARSYGQGPPPGEYWYDTRSGAWGRWGREAAGYIQPGHDYGPLPEDASAGTTGVFINGREITLVEATRLQQLAGAVYRGRWWLDGRTGAFGLEGNPAPIGNLLALLQSRSGGGGGRDNFWSSGDARGNSSGGCSYVSVDGRTATSGCD